MFSPIHSSPLPMLAEQFFTRRRYVEVSATGQSGQVQPTLHAKTSNVDAGGSVWRKTLEALMRIIDDAAKRLGCTHKQVFYRAYQACLVSCWNDEAETDWRRYCQSNYTHIEEEVENFCIDVLSGRVSCTTPTRQSA